MSDDRFTPFPGGFRAILKRAAERQEALSTEDDEALPPLDVELASLKTRLIDPDAPEMGISRSGYARKYRELALQFGDRPALLHLHGLLIAHLRRKEQPAHTAQLFVRLWAEEAAFLLAELDPRWLVSAVTTFGDHGQNAAQRKLGQALSVLFGMMKLYEAERLFSGLSPDTPFDGQKSHAALPMRMDPYSLDNGGLDVNMLASLWEQTSKDKVLRPLARRLLTLLIEDPATLFARFQHMRTAREAQGIRRKGRTRKERMAKVPAAALPQGADGLRWGTVSMVKAPLLDIARFAAHHLELGADRVTLYLDDPQPGVAEYLSRHDKISVIACDGAFWEAQKKPRMKAHQMRQAYLATQAYYQPGLHWIAHIDVDEFLMPQVPMRELLASVPVTDAMLRLPPAELLAGSQGDELFKLTPAQAGHKRGVLEDIYPNFGAHLPGGFVSHREGKNFVRCGLDGIRVGIHGAFQGGDEIANRATDDQIRLGHAHAPDWPFFRDHMAFRMTRGSYRKTDENKMRLLDILQFLQDDSGDDGIRAFFAEVCEASPALVAALEQHGMLLRYPLDLDAKVTRHFGALPGSEE
ncbi:glycosyltransferase family 2 protein [Thalassobius vesicularis]|uniref:Glycosyltransferase family 2 protein n=1 Tax=Thalassobius vesicularis TaxID=1294297 RepID=A0A4S3M7S9_9RHOB|nr:glycosyltransferase family 2 protein [Thalassobius vesicularis]THD73402.1 glycosyltransferase family 2 protein [Thalassobius vesicularis]